MTFSSIVQSVKAFVAIVFAVFSGHALTQNNAKIGSALLSPPIAQAGSAPAQPPNANNKPANAPAPAGMGNVDLSGRSGPGVHSPLSPFSPLPERKDVVPWTTLTKVETKTEKNKVIPVHTKSVMALNQKTQRIQGFMMPLQPGEKQTHFLLSQVPLTCGFCTPGGPESMVEVRSKTRISYGFDVVVVEGTFQVLQDDPYGLFYRMVDAVQVK
jgi:hypothetical protein